MNGRMRVGLVVILALALAACAPGAATSTGGITVTDAWARPSATMDGAGAAYMVLHNGGSAADKLLSAATSAATTVEMHESTEMDN